MTWISETVFVRNACHGYAYAFASHHEAAEFQRRHGGQFWTEHSGEGRELAYSRGAGMVNVLGYVVLLEAKIGGENERRRIWWPGSPE